MHIMCILFSYFLISFLHARVYVCIISVNNYINNIQCMWMQIINLLLPLFPVDSILLAPCVSLLQFERKRCTITLIFSLASFLSSEEAPIFFSCFFFSWSKLKRWWSMHLSIARCPFLKFVTYAFTRTRMTGDKDCYR